MNFGHEALTQAGGLLLRVPAALIILLSREWFTARMLGEKDTNVLEEFSLVSFASLVFSGAAPGGLIRDRPYPLLRFLHGQIWLMAIVALATVYVLLKAPQSDSFSAHFSAVFIGQAWGLWALNWIPLPPFDAAASYFSPYMQWKPFALFAHVLAIFVSIALLLPFWRFDWLTGKILLRWLQIA
ncbi:MAG: hypothetical protein JSR44_15855 [Spirochaetes bacterium]|nr:hypothetical protein [Spirochaetota bacterium]